MSQFFSRCRHLHVNWINSHACQCSGCGKTGHWFENEGLVMWVRDQPVEDDRKPTVSANRIQGINVASHPFSSKAG